MAAKKRKTEIEKFKDVYDDFKFSEFKNINTELDVEFVKVFWIETGEVDSRRNMFKLYFDVENREFNRLLKKDVLGVLGWKGIPFDMEKKKYFIEKSWGTMDEHKELLNSLNKVFLELDKKIDMVTEISPQNFADDAKLFNGEMDSENFFVQYDVEKERVYVVLKSKGSEDFMTFARANTPPSGWGGDAGDVNNDAHKVNLLPGYKDKPFLKPYVRSKCFWISSLNYSMTSVAIHAEKKREDERINRNNAWLENPENLKRVQDVLITEPNEFGLVLKFDERKRAFVFSCKNFECSSYKDTVSNTRDDSLSVLFFNEVLCRPEKEDDTRRSEIDAVARNDDNDLNAYSGFAEFSNNSLGNDVVKGKIILNRRPDSKGKILYLNPIDNIEELEVLKKNYEDFKVNTFSKFKKFNLDKVNVGIWGLNDNYPILYLDRYSGGGYLLFNGSREINEEKDSHFFKSDFTLELSEEQVNYILDKKNETEFTQGVYNNFKKFHQLVALGTTVFGDQEIAFFDELVLAWKTQRVMNKMGIKLIDNTQFEKKDNDDLGNSFKL